MTKKDKLILRVSILKGNFLAKVDLQSAMCSKRRDLGSFWQPRWLVRRISRRNIVKKSYKTKYFYTKI